MAKKINRRGRGGSQRVVVFLCVPLRSLRFSESSQKIIKSLDAPGKTWIHWVIYNIPADRLPAAMPKDSSLNDGSLQGKNDFGRIGYNGPCPPPGKPHRYFFKVYALDTNLDLKSGATKAQLEAAMSGHILAQGEMIGKYGR